MKLEIIDKETNEIVHEYDDVYIDTDGEVWLIEERTFAYQTYMYKECISEKVRIRITI
jgi:hypothetical protein